MNSYDFVIVGGGAAGCVLANRLTASGKYRVLLLEAGGEPRSMWIDIPAGFSKLLNNQRYNWRFKTEAEANTNQRVISVPRGKGLGGSTIINGMIYVRGQASDYDSWRDGGATGWGFEDVEPYFRKLERYEAGGPGRGHDGPMNIEQVRVRFPISDAYIAAAEQSGLPFNEDYNAGDQEGVGYYQVTQRGGRRWSVYAGYLQPALRRENLRVETNAHVLRLELEGKRCTGATYRKNGQDVTVKAGIEVILSAGAIQTPQLLELSGIGRPALLKDLALPVRHALDGVGENYIDHLATRMNWRVKDALTLNEMTRGWRLGMQVAQYFTQRKGILTLGTGLVNTFVKTRPELHAPDAQYFFVHASYANAAERVLDRQPGMTIGVSQMRPQSVGSIHIKSRDPSACPSIRPNFLSSPIDQECMVRSMQIARSIVQAPALKPYVVEEMSPGPDVRSNADWLAFARANGQTIYHPIGTCRMGSDDSAVVDPRLKVRGLEGLRVIDASVMPMMVSGNIQAAVMMVAEKASDMVLEDASRRAEHATHRVAEAIA